MTKSKKANHDTKMTITVLGREVSMQFAEKPNPQVATQVKQALLGAYLPAQKQGSQV